MKPLLLLNAKETIPKFCLFFSRNFSQQQKWKNTFPGEVPEHITVPVHRTAAWFGHTVWVIKSPSITSVKSSGQQARSLY